jgi:hypothetical protein
MHQRDAEQVGQTGADIPGIGIVTMQNRRQAGLQLDVFEGGIGEVIQARPALYP